MLVSNSPSLSRKFLRQIYIAMTASYCTWKLSDCLGGPTAAVIAYHNPDVLVTVVDKNEERIRRWNSKHLPIYEPGLAEIVRIARDGSKGFRLPNEPAENDNTDSMTPHGAYNRRNGPYSKEKHVHYRIPNLIFSDKVSESISAADIVLIAVNTPTKSRGVGAGSATDMTAFEAVTKEVARHAMPGAIIVEKSTVPCRTAEFIQKTMTNQRPGVYFEILSNPEFLSAGTAVKDLMHPDRILIGSSKTPSGLRAADALARIYEAWVPRSRIIKTNVYSSELSKLVANSMLAQRISSINSISAICEKTGADVSEIAESIGCDPRIGDKFLKAGIGFGGSCFKKDILSLVYLAESLGLDEVGEYWRQVVKMNEYQRDRFSRRVIQRLNNTLAGKKTTLLGYAFKANTSDTRESPAFEIIKTFLEEGPRQIAVYDPCCNPEVVKAEIKQLLKDRTALEEDGGPIAIYSNVYNACEHSDAILITTEFDEFRSTPTESNESNPSSQSLRLVDPRPFYGQPSPMDIFLLQKYLLSTAPAGRYPNDDPFKRYLSEPSCPSTCPDCNLIRTSGLPAGGNSDENRLREKLDWRRISSSMKRPKLLFDGKGIIDASELAPLGIHVESVGRR
ncbi:nucleotide sugar dehydrogenase [Daldinia eschscholtzii]|nr:nucleotide sugar dehydrogenase [Daldinia eschscholtzii]